MIGRANLEPKTYLIQCHCQRTGYGQTLAVLEIASEGRQVADCEDGMIATVAYCHREQ